MTATRTQGRRVASGAALNTRGGTAPGGAAYDLKFVASTERLASDGGIILTSAWESGLAAYRKRPLFIAAHDLAAQSGKLTEVALGRVVHVAVESGLPTDLAGPSGRGLVAYVAFASTPFAREVKSLYDEGVLNDVSVRWDWRTEIVRMPTAAEQARWGPELSWICERADLIELSSVLLGADAGAQALRARGRTFPAVEAFIRDAVVLPDALATAEAVDAAQKAARGLEEWRDALSGPRQELGEALSSLQTLLTAANNTFEGGEALAESPANEAVHRLVMALAALDVATRDIGGAVAEIGDAIEAVGRELGVGAITVSDRGRQIQIDVAAVLADKPKPLTIDLDAIRRDGR